MQMRNMLFVEVKEKHDTYIMSTPYIIVLIDSLNSLSSIIKIIKLKKQLLIFLTTNNRRLKD